MAPTVETRFLRLDPEHFDAELLEPAAASLREGGLVAFPTETVYGIGVDLDRPEAVSRLLEIRRSPQEKHITVHISSREDLLKLLKGPVPPAAQRLIRRFWPGPLTLVFPSSDGRGMGVRFPHHRIAIELIRRAGVRVGAPSANLRGCPPAAEADAVRADFDQKVDWIIDGGPAHHKTASTVVRIVGRKAEILREGAIPRGVIDEVNAATILFVCTGNTCRSPMAERIARLLLAKRLGVTEGDLEARGYRILSAGTAAGVGASAPSEAVEAARGVGAELADHSSRPVSVSMIEDADRIYVMTKSHREVLEEWMPEAADRVALLDPSGADIADPIGGTLEEYQACAKRLQDSIEKRLDEVV